MTEKKTFEEWLGTLGEFSEWVEKKEESEDDNKKPDDPKTPFTDFKIQTPDWYDIGYEMGLYDAEWGVYRPEYIVEEYGNKARQGYQQGHEDY